jgi:hypothetical protein
MSERPAGASGRKGGQHADRYKRSVPTMQASKGARKVHHNSLLWSSPLSAASDGCYRRHSRSPAGRYHVAVESARGAEARPPRTTQHSSTGNDESALNGKTGRHSACRSWITTETVSVAPFREVGEASVTLE